jgi:2-oxoglutarate ferredoxin oxidoreductase subunit alpha
MAREAGIKIGCIQLLTVWPFPSSLLRDMLHGIPKVIVAELNMGQLVYEIERLVGPQTQVSSLLRYDGEILTPAQFLAKIEEVR